MTLSFETTSGHKQSCRDALIAAVREVMSNNPNQPRIFTLPSEEHICYSQFKEVFPLSSIFCINYDKNICQVLNNKGITTENTSTNEYFSSFPKWQAPFNSLFLDYFSFYNESVEEDLRNIANKPNITGSDWTAIGITLSKAIRADKDGVREKVNKSLKTKQDENILVDLDSMRAYIGCEIFSKYHVKYCFDLEYTAKEDKTSATMWFICIKVKRK